MTAPEEGLKAGEVIQQVHEGLLRKWGVQVWDFYGEGPCTLGLIIGDDSDHHRSRTGYMLYSGGILLYVEGTHWFAAVGRKGGDYPADHYDSDLMIVKLWDECRGGPDILRFFTKMSLFKGHQAWIGSNRFEFSLLVAMANGEIKTNLKYGHFGKEFEEGLKTALKAHQVCEIKTDDKHILASTLRAPVTQAARYSPALVPPLVELASAVLLKK